MLGIKFPAISVRLGCTEQSETYSKGKKRGGNLRKNRRE